MVIRFDGQVALVTGAAMGLGLATAEAFARAGAAVALVDADERSLNEASRRFALEGLSTFPITCDVSDERAVRTTIEQVLQMFGRLDFAYNNAGVMNELKTAKDQSVSEFDRVTSINLRGVWACMKYEIEAMLKTGSGAIVNCSSIGGIRGGAERGIYHAAKHGVIGLTTSAAIEFAAQGIRINSVCPGTFDTPLVRKLVHEAPEANDAILGKTPIGRMGKPSELANAVLWLCSDQASYVVGHSLVIDGGLTI